MIAPPASLIEKDKTTLNALHPEVVLLLIIVLITTFRRLYSEVVLVLVPVFIAVPITVLFSLHYFFPKGKIKRMVRKIGFGVGTRESSFNFHRFSVRVCVESVRLSVTLHANCISHVTLATLYSYPTLKSLALISTFLMIE